LNKWVYSVTYTSYFNIIDFTDNIIILLYHHLIFIFYLNDSLELNCKPVSGDKIRNITSP